MSSYQGPATVLLGKEEFTATADLELSVEKSHFIGGKPYDTLIRWDGTLDAAPHIDWISAPLAREATLRMPDGREGKFVATAGVHGSGHVEICGIGPAPFDE